MASDFTGADRGEAEGFSKLRGIVSDGSIDASRLGSIWFDSPLTDECYGISFGKIFINILKMDVFSSFFCALYLTPVL